MVCGLNLAPRLERFNEVDFFSQISVHVQKLTDSTQLEHTVRNIENGPRARECTLQPNLTELFALFNPYLSFGAKFWKIRGS